MSRILLNIMLTLICNLGVLKVFSEGVHELPIKDSIFYTFGINDLSDEEARSYKSLGVTSVETYVTWESCESTGENHWDWSRWDELVKTLKKNDLKWVPFLILGPAYSTPDWFRNSNEHIPSRCLEHGVASKIESLWNPNLPKRIERFIEAFAKRYKDEDVIESVLLGIQGDFGEAIYSVYGGGWTFNIPGKYHNHAGFWCNDIYALRDFRAYFERKYRSLDKLNGEWGTHFERFNEMEFPGYTDSLRRFIKEVKTRENSEINRQWLDFVEWYRFSMTQWSEWWIETTRKYFAQLPIYLCTGGDAIPEHGSNFAEQVRVASKYDAGVRITNEGSDYRQNFAVTRWVASAGKHYHGYYGFEPAGAEDEKGIIARIYNATSSGANQLHDYATNITQSTKRQRIQKENFEFLKKEDPLVNVALWYPNTSLTLNFDNDKYLQKAAELRSYTDFDFIDESMLHTGALDHYKVLIMLYGDVMEDTDAMIINEWSKKGGRLIASDMPPIKNVKGFDKPNELLFEEEIKSAIGKNEKIVYHFNNWESFDKTLNNVLEGLELPIYTKNGNDVFVTQLKKNEWLILNTGEEDSKILLKSAASHEIEVKRDGITHFVLP